MSTLLREPSPSPSGNGKLSKLRLGRKTKSANVSSQSLLGSSTDGEDPARESGRRMSVEGLVDKLSPGLRRSSDDKRRSMDVSRLSKLVTGKLKRRKSDASNTDERPSSNQSDSDAIERLSPNRSDLSLGLDSGNSSLLTEDDDDDKDIQGRPVRPSISPHNSHAPYLTLSSPLIKTQTTESVPDQAQTAPANTAFFSPETEAETAPQNLAKPPTNTDQISSPLRAVFSRGRKPVAASTPPAASAPIEGGVNGGSAQLNKSEGGVDWQHNIDTSHNGETAQEQEIPDDQSVKARFTGPNKNSVRIPRIDTTGRPKTPPNTTPTPSTFVTPPTPTLAQVESPPKKATAPKLSLSPKSAPNSVTGGRTRPKSASLGGSKLSNAISASPLTPTLEETKTPGGTLSAPSGSFFSNWVSAAQNAANTIGSTFGQSGPTNQKTKQTEVEAFPDIGVEEVIPGPETQPQSDSQVRPPPAIETLGQGELNLGHLGITDVEGLSPMSSTVSLDGQSSTKGMENQLKAEEDAAARAVSVAYEKPVATVVSQATGARPLSVASQGSGQEHSPPRTATFPPDSADIKRSGSIRSKLSDRKQRRHRASSATTGGTLAAVISASTSTIANPTAHKNTGFAVASVKRNKDFHQLFRSVPEDDYLIEDYSAALQRDILLHGRFYVSEGHVCFSSNILGWVTNLVIAFDEIVSIEKKNTAIVFPNALVIQTLHARNTFASFVARDSTYDLLVSIWKTTHPNLKSSINGVTLGDESGTGDKTEKAESMESGDGSDDGSDDVYDEDAEDGEDFGSFTEAGANGSVAGSDIGETIQVPRKASTMPVSTSATANAATVPKGLENADPVVTGAAVSADFPGPPLHEATECADTATHYDKPLTDVTIPAPLGKIYSMMFGPASGAFMKKWLVDDQKSREVQYEDDKTGMDDAHKTFQYSYIKPLNAPVGPKQTKCIVTCTLQAFDLEKAVSVDCSTQTPDVPSGGIFVTKTRYCLMWGPGNTTRMIANCTIEWSGKSWLKGPIEKGANDGQTQYIKDLIAALKAAVTTKPPVKGQPRGKTKGKRRKETYDTTGTEAERAAAETAAAEKNASWGLLEPLHGPLGPIVSIIGSLVSAQVVIAFLLILLMQAWFFSGRKSSSVGFAMTAPERMAAYEAMWQREESELWNWLEDRVGLEDAMLAQRRNDAKTRQKVLKRNVMAGRLVEEKMSQRQIDDAIRATEERLEALKEAVNVKKSKGKT